MEEELPAEKDSYGFTMLDHACRSRDVAAVISLVQHRGIDVNARGVLWMDASALCCCYARKKHAGGSLHSGRESSGP